MATVMHSTSLLLTIAFVRLGAPTFAADAPPATTWPPPGVSFLADPAVPDISGLWQFSETGVPGVEPPPNRGSADGAPLSFWHPWPLPYTPAGMWTTKAIPTDASSFDVCAD